MTIRLANPEDAAVIAALCADALGYEAAPEFVRDRLLCALKSARERVFVAELDGAVVGFIHAEDYDVLYYPSLKNVLGLAVFEKARRRGVGRALLGAVEAWARRNGARGVRLSSGASRADAHAFYRAVGYSSEKAQIRFVKVTAE